jgi:hypothetical protein
MTNHLPILAVIKSLIGGKKAARRNAERKATLLIELLETRDVMATTLIWVGPLSAPNAPVPKWSNPENWINQATGLHPTNKPGSGDTLLFGSDWKSTVGGKTGADTNSWDDIGNLKLASLQLSAQYSSLLTLDQDLATTRAVMVNGTIDSVRGRGDFSIGSGGGGFTWSGGALASDTTITGTFLIEGTSSKEIGASSIMLSGANTVWSGGNINFDTNNSLSPRIFMRGGAFTITADNVGIRRFGNGLTSGSLINQGGIFQKTKGAGTVTVDLNFTNRGQALYESGTVVFTGSYLQSAGVTSLGPGNIRGNHFKITGGSLRGYGTITGNVTITGSNTTVSPSVLYPGPNSSYSNADNRSLTITGDYSQYEGILDIGVSYNSDMYSRIAVVGKVTLGQGAQLQVDTLDNPPPSGEEIPFMGWGMLEGTYPDNPAGMSYPGGSWVPSQTPGVYWITATPSPTGGGAGPGLTSVSPASGPTSGGTAVTLSGSNFTNVEWITFGGIAVSTFTVISSSSITVTAPPGLSGTVNVAVTTASGSSSFTSGGRFTYTAVSFPVVSNLATTSGTSAGGTTVIIDGSDLTGTTAVLFGSIPATAFVVNSEGQLTAIAPGQTAGTVDITVVTPSGTSSVTSSDEFTYTSGPGHK